MKVAQLCLTLCHPMDYTVRGVLQARTGVVSRSLLQGTFPTQGSNPGLPHYRQILYQLSHTEALVLIHFSSVTQLCPTLCNPMNRSIQASLSITNSRSSLRLTSIESVMPSSHLILLSPSPPAPNPSQHQSLFQ